MKRILHEPLVYFLIFGGALFFLFGWMRSEDPAETTDTRTTERDTARYISKRIVVSRGELERQIEKFNKTWQRAPTKQEFDGLIEDYIREEVMYRQALELGLDREDPLVKRRMRQKLEFISEDIADLVEPGNDDLNSFLESNAEEYRLDPKFTFRQVYLNESKRGGTIDSDITSLLGALNQAGPAAEISEMGDSLLLEQEFKDATQGEVAGKFGREFSEALPKVAIGSWQGPVRSGFGLHLVYISERIDGRVPPLDEIRDVVTRDWSAAKRRESNEAIYQNWRSGYVVEIEKLTIGEETVDQ